MGKPTRIRWNCRNPPYLQGTFVSCPCISWKARVMLYNLHVFSPLCGMTFIAFGLWSDDVTFHSAVS